MRADERKGRIAILGKQLVQLIHAEHPQLAPDEIEGQLAEVLSKVLPAVLAGDEAEAEIQASRMPPLTPATKALLRAKLAELWTLVSEDLSAERAQKVRSSVRPSFWSNNARPIFWIPMLILFAVLFIVFLLEPAEQGIRQPEYTGVGELMAWGIILLPVILGIGVLYVVVHFVRKYW